MHAFVLLLLAAAGYWLWITLVPFKICRRCHGNGRTRRATGRGLPKPCQRCRGLGVRPRLIGKASRALRQVRRDAGAREIRIRL